MQSGTLQGIPHSERSRVEEVHGAVSLAECDLLYALAADVREGCIVEVGSFRGRSTVALALGSMAGANIPVYAVEPHESFTGVLGGEFGPIDRTHFFKNMVAAGVTEVVRLINVSSEIITPGWSRPVGLLWIDGDHRYAAVRRDFESWIRFLRPGAVVALHDSLDPDLGPARVVDEAIKSRRFVRAHQFELTTVLRFIS